MNQVFYIDAEEEITSAIDRLKKSTANRNYFVVPQRSLVLQSLVNLKLLKREAEKGKKQIVIVTQSPLGSNLAKKAEIETCSSIDGLEVGQINNEVELSIDGKRGGIYENKKVAKNTNKKSRLENIGSEEFFEEAIKKNPYVLKNKKAVVQNAVALPKIVPEKIYRGEERGQVSSQKNPTMNDVLPVAKERIIKEPMSMGEIEQESIFDNKLNLKREAQLESLFMEGAKTEEKDASLSKKENFQPVSLRARKFVVLFVAVCLALILGILIYLFVPHADILVYPKLETNEVDIDISAIESQNFDEKLENLPIRIIEKETVLKETFNSLGKSGSSGDKSRGKIVIFNEYGSLSQPLVATTRFLSENGKLFRLIKGVTVPGTTSVGGEIKPGAIEAEVIADESGEDYNIEPSKFSIPGLEGGPKFEKMYAKSENSMAGGKSSGALGIVSISQLDIDNARKKVEADAKSQALEGLKSEIPEGEIVLPEAINQTIEESISLSRAGEAKSNFEYEVKIKSVALAFKTDNIKRSILKSFQEKSGINKEISPVNVEIEYRQVAPDFQSRSMQIKVHGKLFISPSINLADLKKEFLGKNRDQFRDVLKKYPQIEGIEISFWPKFLPEKIPQYPGQVKLEIKDGVDKK